MLILGKKILVIGYNGSGKTTLAFKLGAILGMEVIHLDALYWNPGWIGTPLAEWLKLVDELLAKKSWIMEGFHETTIDTRIEAADTIIFLDFPRLLCLYRAIKRHFLFLGKSRPGMTPGCPSRFDWPLVKKLWTNPVKKRFFILNKIKPKMAEKKIIILHSPREVDDFIQGIYGKEYNITK